VARRITTINIANLKDIPKPCSLCSYWGSPFDEKKIFCDNQVLKSRWFMRTTRAWGECGKMVYVGKQAVAYTRFAPHSYFPRVKEYAAGPSSDDAIFIACLFVVPSYRGKGYGKDLLREVVKSFYKSGFKAVETFGNRTAEARPSAPFEFYLKNGFRVVHDDKMFPLMRLDFKSIIAWQDGLEMLLGGIKFPLPGREISVPY